MSELDQGPAQCKPGYWMIRMTLCHKKKIELYPLCNWVRARHTLDTKTNHCAPKTQPLPICIGKLPRMPMASQLALKPAACRLDTTPIPPDAPKTSGCTSRAIVIPKGSTSVGSHLGGNPACPPNSSLTSLEVPSTSPT